MSTLTGADHKRREFFISHKSDKRHHRHVTACFSAGFPIRVEEIIMTVGTEPAVFDVVSRDSGLFEEAAVRIVQIEEVLPIGVLTPNRS